MDQIENVRMPKLKIRALLFDVFGTVVDWHGSIVREGALLGAKLNLSRDWSAFADAWRAGYIPAMDRVRKGTLPWMNIDALHRLILNDLLEKFDLTHLSEMEKDHLNRVWHRLTPWSDSVGGLNRLKASFPIATLSNGNVCLLMNMARNAGLPWDVIFSAELFGQYKPDLEVYQKAAAYLGFANEEVMLVAAHPGDLEAAKRAGLRTAFISRPMEYGALAKAEHADKHNFDFKVTSFYELAHAMRYCV
jgi:2-haloacid dehalogenase